MKKTLPSLLKRDHQSKIILYQNISHRPFAGRLPYSVTTCSQSSHTSLPSSIPWVCHWWWRWRLSCRAWWWWPHLLQHWNNEEDHNLKFTSSWDSCVKQSPSISLSAFQLSGELDLNIRFYEKEGSKLLTMVYSFKFIASRRIYHPIWPSITNRQKIKTNSFRFIAVRYPLQAKHLCTQSRFDLLIIMEIWMDENEDSFPCYDVRSNLFGIVEMKSCWKSCTDLAIFSSSLGCCDDHH